MPTHRTIPHTFHALAREFQGNVLFRYKREEEWRAITWGGAIPLLREISYGLLALGIHRGDRVAIFSETRMEWSLADHAIADFGGVTVGIYPTDTARQVEYILGHCEAKVVWVSHQAMLEKVLSVWKNLPNLTHIVVLDPATLVDEKRVVTFSQLCRWGAEKEQKEPQLLDQLRDEIQPTDTLTIIYTSGTTGPPKGAVLTHAHFLFMIETMARVVPLNSTDVGLIFMPLCHVFQRIVNYIGIYAGATGVFVESLDRVAPTMKEAHPTVVASVPRLYEKAYARIGSQVHAAHSRRQAIFHWACRVGHERSRLLRSSRLVPFWLRLQYALASLLVFRKIRAALGGRTRFLVSGGAPISIKILEFFHAAGILVFEGYGLTETTAITTANCVEDYKLGTVGKPIPGVEVEIAEDGEILVRGPNIFKGYFKDPEKTAEAIDSEGWFHTGDIGEIDQEGFLKITDRKKDLIITAGGKNVAPQNIENLIKGHPLISQVMVYGDRRKYLTALITLDIEEAKIFGKERGIPFSSLSEFVMRPDVQDFVRERIEEKNQELARYEQIKKFRILPNDFSIEEGTLTPTQKIKRRMATEKYRAVLDQLYDEILD